MTHLFYATGLLFLIYEIYFLFNLVEKVNNVEKCKQFTKENKDAKYDDIPQELKVTVREIVIVGIPYILWLFLGLLSSQWLMFGLLLVFSFVIIYPIRKLAGFSPLRYVVTGIDTVVCILVIAFIIINKYHLHIDT